MKMFGMTIYTHVIKDWGTGDLTHYRSVLDGDEFGQVISEFLNELHGGGSGTFEGYCEQQGHMIERIDDEEIFWHHNR